MAVSSFNTIASGSSNSMSTSYSIDQEDSTINIPAGQYSSLSEMNVTLETASGNEYDLPIGTSTIILPEPAVLLKNAIPRQPGSARLGQYSGTTAISPIGSGFNGESFFIANSSGNLRVTGNGKDFTDGGSISTLAGFTPDCIGYADGYIGIQESTKTVALSSGPSSPWSSEGTSVAIGTKDSSLIFQSTGLSTSTTFQAFNINYNNAQVGDVVLLFMSTTHDFLFENFTGFTQINNLGPSNQVASRVYFRVVNQINDPTSFNFRARSNDFSTMFVTSLILRGIKIPDSPSNYKFSTTNGQAVDNTMNPSAVSDVKKNSFAVVYAVSTRQGSSNSVPSGYTSIHSQSIGPTNGRGESKFQIALKKITADAAQEAPGSFFFQQSNVNGSAQAQTIVFEFEDSISNINLIKEVNNRYFAIGDSLLFSSDKIAWNNNALPVSTPLLNVEYVGNLYYLAGSNALATSSNGVTWSIRNVTGLAGSITAFSYSDGTFIVGSSTGQIITSKNGTTWSTSLAALESAVRAPKFLWQRNKRLRSGVDSLNFENQDLAPGDLLVAAIQWSGPEHDLFPKINSSGWSVLGESHSTNSQSDHNFIFAYKVVTEDIDSGIAFRARHSFVGGTSTNLVNQNLVLSNSNVTVVVTAYRDPGLNPKIRWWQNTSSGLSAIHNPASLSYTGSGSLSLLTFVLNNKSPSLSFGSWPSYELENLRHSATHVFAEKNFNGTLPTSWDFWRDTSNSTTTTTAAFNNGGNQGTALSLTWVIEGEQSGSAFIPKAITYSTPYAAIWSDNEQIAVLDTRNNRHDVVSDDSGITGSYKHSGSQSGRHFAITDNGKIAYSGNEKYFSLLTKLTQVEEA